MTDDEIEDLANAALDAACLLIQEKLEISTGDLAAQFFADGVVHGLLKSYIRSELAWDYGSERCRCGKFLNDCDC